jgi:hypothetical protein
MKVNGNNSSPARDASPLNDDAFTIDELHALATDPDFKVSLSHAKKLGVKSLDVAQTLMEEAPLTQTSVIALFAIARSHLAWLCENTGNYTAQLTRQLSDERLLLLDSSSDEVSAKLFRECMKLLVDSAIALTDSPTKPSLSEEVSNLVGLSADEMDAATKLFPLLFSVIIPKWEQKATAVVQNNKAFYARAASNYEIDSFSRIPYANFEQGQTGRWINRAIESPQKHGLKNSSFAGTFAVHNLQAALLCDVISYDKEIAIEAVPETLQLDLTHLQRLQKQFSQLVKAQCVTDFYASICGETQDKSELFKTALWALQKGDESFGLNLKPQELSRLNSLLGQKDNPVAKIHRERMRALILESANSGKINQTLVDKWRYGPVLEHLNTLHEHVTRILQVHFPVFQSVYSNLLERQLEATIWTSILSTQPSIEFRNWLETDDQAKADCLQSAFRDLVKGFSPLVPADQQNALISNLQRCLFENAGWADFYNLLTVKHSVDFNALAIDLKALSKSVSEFRRELQKKRYDKCVEEQKRIVPMKPRAGFR